MIYIWIEEYKIKNSKLNYDTTLGNDEWRQGAFLEGVPLFIEKHRIMYTRSGFSIAMAISLMSDADKLIVVNRK